MIVPANSRHAAWKSSLMSANMPPRLRGGFAASRLGEFERWRGIVARFVKKRKRKRGKGRKEGVLKDSQHDCPLFCALAGGDVKGTGEPADRRSADASQVGRGADEDRGNPTRGFDGHDGASTCVIDGCHWLRRR